MRQSLVISARAMDAFTQRMSVTSNNLANINTVGFKRDQTLISSFQSKLSRNINAMNDPDIPGEVRSVTDFSSGNFRFTNDKLNMALEGEGFFKLQLENGEVAYTRKGTFKLDSSNKLITGENQVVMGKNGPIILTDSDFTVSASGVVYDKSGSEINELDIVKFKKPYPLEKVGSSLFVNTNPAESEIASDAMVKQMYVEESNVDELSAMIEMLNMLESMRQYESTQKVVQLHDQATGQLLSQIGRV